MLSGLPIYDTMMGAFMTDTSDYVKKYFFVFFLGALFGAIYECTGAAKIIALGIVKVSKGKFTASIIAIITGLLTFGGISGFVVFFVIYPIALQLFKENNISRRILPGAISAGCWTFSMILPASPSIQNVIAARELGTPMNAAMIPGIVAAIFELVAIILWLEWRTISTKKKGQFFDEKGITPLPVTNDIVDMDTSNLPKFTVAILPIICMISTFNFFPKIFKIETSIALALILSLVLLYKYLPGTGMEKITSPLNTGGMNGVSAIMNTALVVGFGGVVGKTPGFAHLVNNLVGIKMSPLAFVAISVAICAGAVGSASGGLTIAFRALTPTFKEMGVNFAHVHRIGVIAAGTLDTLPHQGAQITLLNLCHVNHKEGYLDIFVTQILIPFLALFLAIPLCNMGL